MGTAPEADKDIAGTALSEQSRVWFTVARGHLSEVFHPAPDRVCIRSLTVEVRCGDRVEREADWVVTCTRPYPGVPLARTISRGAGIEVEREVIADPRSDVVLQRMRVRAPAGSQVFIRLESEPDTGIAHALACNVDRLAPDTDLVHALAFAYTHRAAAHMARSALARGYDAIRDDYIHRWREWIARAAPQPGRALWEPSLAVLATLEAKRVDGGRVAALATPWGNIYHAAWTRDLAHCMGGMLAAGIHEQARATLVFLRTTQHPDGHWPQNMLLDGEHVWTHEELDEAAHPILLVELLHRERVIDERAVDELWPMVSRAADHLARVGPSTTLDRWEDATGITPYTLATEIAALRYAGRRERRFAEIAERWCARVDDLYRRGGPLADRLGTAGYFVRARTPGEPLPDIDPAHLPPTELGVDALALVRYGILDARDPRIGDTVRAIDAVLAVDFPFGRVWRRYPGDTYGGPESGHPWPLLTGERGHFELARGDRAAAASCIATIEACANACGMLPEQFWDGGPCGSASPLGWAHAEYMKLCRSIADGRVFDRPTVTR